MTLRLPVAVLVTIAVTGTAVPEAEAQLRPEPQLLLTIAGGASSGSTLYADLRQPVVLLEDPFAIDTLALARRITPGILLGASATYFPRPNLGITAEISFVGFGRDDTCRLVYQAPSNLSPTSTEQICADMTAVGGTASTFSFEVGGLYRLWSRGAVRPYVRLQGGITSRSASTVEVAGRYLDADNAQRSRVLIIDPDPGSIDPTLGLALGVMIPFATGYQARLELRDRLLFVERITGPASSLAIASTETAMFHSFGLVFMLDIVLEQRRGRRY